MDHYHDYDTSTDYALVTGITYTYVPHATNEYHGYENCPFLKFRASDLTAEYFFVFGHSSNHNRCDGVEVDPTHNYFILAISTRVWSDNGTFDHIIAKGNPKTGALERMVRGYVGNQEDTLEAVAFNWDGNFFVVTG